MRIFYRKNKHMMILVVVLAMLVQMVVPGMNYSHAELEIEDDVITVEGVVGDNNDDEDLDSIVSDDINEEDTEDEGTAIGEDDEEDNSQLPAQATDEGEETEAITGVGLFSAEPKELVNIFKGVSLKIQHGSGEPVEIRESDIVEIEDNTVILLEFHWEIEDNSDKFELVDGDWAEIAIPTLFEEHNKMPASGYVIFNVDGDEITVGTYALENNMLKVVFNNELVGLKNRKGDVWLGLQFNEEIIKGNAKQTITFEEPIDRTYNITVKPKGNNPAIKKSGSPNEPINATYINWVIDVNTSLDKLSNAIVEDTIPAGLELMEGSIEIYDLTIGYDGEVKEEKLSSKEATGFPIVLGEVDSAYRIKYKTDIVDSSKNNYDNIATLKDGVNVKGTANCDIGSLQVGKPIDKTGVPENPDESNAGQNSTKITWTIDVNKAELNLDNVSIDDIILDSRLSIVNSSIRIFKLSKSGKDFVVGDEVTSVIFSEGTEKKFPFDLGDLNELNGKTYRITFDTNISYTEYHPSNTFSNTAVLKVKGDQKGTDTATVTVNRETLLEKYGVETTNYGDPEIEWTVHVNRANHSIINATITDTISAGLTLMKNDNGDYDIKIYDHNGVLVSLVDSPGTPSLKDITDNGFVANLGTITTYYKIVYKTKITDPTQAKDNTAELSGTGLKGDGIGSDNSIRKEATPSNEVKNIYTKEKEESNKTIDTEEGKITYDGLNHTDKTMSWKITVDAVKEEITELTITDSFFTTADGSIFTPSNSMVFIKDSLRIIKGSEILKEDDDYIIQDNGAGGFILSFTNPIDRAKYEIYYKTSFDPNEVLSPESGGELNPNRTYINQAVFSGTTKDVKGLNHDINEKRTAKYDINQVVFNGGKKDVDLDRENRKIKWTIYVNALGQDLTKREPVEFFITDTLSSTDSTDPGQVFDKGSIVVKEYTLNKDGSIIPGAVLPKEDENENYNYTVAWNDTEHEFTLTFPHGIKKPYMVEFYTNIVGLSKEKYKNSAQITGRVEAYTAEEKYEDYKTFLIKDAGTTTVYSDDEINWKLTINESLSPIEAGAVLVDTISKGLVYIENSLKIKNPDGDELFRTTEDTEGDYTLENELNAKGERVLTITFKDGFNTRYFVEYTTVVVAGNGEQINNKAVFNGESTTTTDTEDIKFNVTQYSGATGSGVRSGNIKITKYNTENENKKLKDAEFKLYYLLNGEPYYVKASDGTDIHRTNSQGVLEFKGLNIRTYYLQEVKAPAGYEKMDKEELQEALKDYEIVEVNNEEGSKDVSIKLKLDNINKSIVLEVPNNRIKINVEGTKKWLGGSNDKPTIKLQLYQNSKALGDPKEPIETENGIASCTWENLYKADENGEDYVYTVDEVNVPENYIKSVSDDGLTVTNTYVSSKIEKTGNKVWVNGPEPKPTIQLRLLQNNVQYGELVTLADGEISYTWTDLDKTDVHGIDYKYAVEEVSIPEDYGMSVSDDGLTITNTYQSPKRDVIGKKVWVNGPSIRPTIELQLYRNGIPYGRPVELSGEAISYKWSGLDKTDEKGIDYVYTVDEVNVPENYEKSVSDKYMTVTNTYIIPKIDITGKKVWIGGSSTRPAIELQLYRDGEAFGEPVKLEDGETEYIWTGLDKTDIDGKEHKYTIDEVKVPSGYRKSISSDGLTITNSYRPPVDPEPPTKPKEPEKPTEPPTKPEEPEKPTEPPTKPEEPEKPTEPEPEPKPEPEEPTIVTPPENGTVEFDEDGNWKYTPNPGFKGKDKFVIRHPDGTEELIEIDVDDIPLGTVLPKTGEGSKIGYYITGLLLVFLGLFLRRKIV
ncbi:collagen binding domain-containing protein [Proteiniborus sp. MB09-C3]|uniref:collagen binding domain-containing protein n=1 Tax=Proteiniborus sp. MB09-C3 TaxID=3050072 RepID=UPI00255551D0|nr:collagen binding domain-containing protein [Proteiniborus sp. MB09-C3]WIV12346.1 collagen binding domain-containing protein [Proteiniborus sp. MB09-C3]